MQRKFKFRLYYLILLLFIFVGCDNNTTNHKVDKSEIFPLEIGNWWIRKLTLYDTSGQKIYFDTLCINRDTIINNEKWFFISGYSPDINSNIIGINRKDGYYDAAVQPGNEINPTLRYKYPCNEGDFYTFGNDTVFVLVVNDRITVEPGTFDCIKYMRRYSGENLEGTKNYTEVYYYISPNHGLILSEIYHQKNKDAKFDLKGKVELNEFFIK